MKGKLIVIDGGDGAGKATQAALLVKQLRADGHAVETLDFPQYTQNTFGELIRECLDGKRGDFMAVDPRIASTLYAADRFESKPRLEQWLSEGKVIILDRYVSSNMMHQGAKIDDPEALEQLTTALQGLPFVRGIRPRENGLDIRVDGPEKALPAIMETTNKIGCLLDGIEYHRPRLDDVFVAHTGRSLTNEPAPPEA